MTTEKTITITVVGSLAIAMIWFAFHFVPQKYASAAADLGKPGTLIMATTTPDRWPDFD